MPRAAGGCRCLASYSVEHTAGIRGTSPFHMNLKSHHHHWKDLLKSLMNDNSFVDDPNKKLGFKITKYISGGVGIRISQAI